MTEAVETILGKTLDARYTLLDKLGAGGQGEVWRAHDKTRGIDVALKILTPKSREHEAWSALEHEYAIASLLDHPSILEVYPPERAGDAMILPMELAPGGDLRRLRGAGFLEIIPVLLEVSQALEHAHERGVVHRDLKPGNILFDARGRAQLADFGVAETAMTEEGTPSTASSAVPTRDTNKHGYSPFTASPAQLRGEPPTPADDVYGLGALAYELLSGYPPYYPHFDKKRAMEERVPILVPTRQIPPLLGTLVMHMLAKDPKRRPRSMREVIDELDAALNDTLTYDFENVSPATPTGSAAVVAAAEAAAARSAAARSAAVGGHGSRAGDTNSADSQAKSRVWTPGSGDRRSSIDRRGRRREDWEPQSPSASDDADDDNTASRRTPGGPFETAASDEPRSTRRPGADALARIDAALERAAADAAAHPRSSPGSSTGLGDTGSHSRLASNGSATAGDTGSHPRVPQNTPAPPADSGIHSWMSKGNGAGETSETGSTETGSRLPQPRPPQADDSGASDTASHQRPSAPPVSTTTRELRYDPTVKIRSPFLHSAEDGTRSRSSHFLSETSGPLGRPKSSQSPKPTAPTANDAVFRPKGSQPAPMTPAEASAIVAAARAAARADAARAEGTEVDTSQTVALPPLTWDTSKTVALPPLSPDYIPPEFRDSEPERPRQTAARSAPLPRKSEPAESPSSSRTMDLSKTMVLPPLSPDYVPPEFRDEEPPRETAAPSASRAPEPEAAELPPRPAADSSAFRVSQSPGMSTKSAAAPSRSEPHSARVETTFPATAREASTTHETARIPTPPLLAPTNPMWPIEGKGPARSSNSTASAIQPSESTSGAAPQAFGEAAAREQAGTPDPFIVQSQPTFRDDTVTVGTYPDPTSILTRDVVQSAPMHVNWGDVRLDELPKLSRLEPIHPRRWPWVVMGLAAGAAAAIYFWLPRFDTRDLPPEIAAVVEPLKAAIGADSPTDGSRAAGNHALDSDAAAMTAEAQAAAAGSAGTGTVSGQDAGATAAVDPNAGAGATAGARSNAGANSTTGLNSTGGANSTTGVNPTGGANSTTGVNSTGDIKSTAGPGTATGMRTSVAGTSAGTPVTPGPVPNSATRSAAKASTTQPFTPAEEQRLRQMRQLFDDRLAALEARGAGVWGGHEFALSKMRAAESVGAHDAGNPRLSQERLTAASKLLDTVEARAPQALSVQVAAGEQALKSGQREVAAQAFALARRINPDDRRATDGQRRAQNLPAVLPLLADAQNAEVDHNYARAAQDYSQALSLDPNNADAKAGQARANAAFGDDSYAKAIGTGFAALGAGRLDEAHESFVKARALNPKGAEASEGLKRVGAALTARGFASMRQRAASLENQERWDEAERTYEDVLAADSSLAFAQEGKVRTISRADLSLRLQQLIDRPDRLSAPGVREDARGLVETARAQSPQGPVIRSQIARLESLLPGYDRPVRLSLVSDNSTQVVISSVGAFGAFSRREIALRPGRYTVTGTRNGFRDVRREITVSPGQDSQTIRVTCSEPI